MIMKRAKKNRSEPLIAYTHSRYYKFISHIASKISSYELISLLKITCGSIIELFIPRYPIYTNDYVFVLCIMNYIYSVSETWIALFYQNRHDCFQYYSKCFVYVKC